MCSNYFNYALLFILMYYILCLEITEPFWSVSTALKKFANGLNLGNPEEDDGCCQTAEYTGTVSKETAAGGEADDDEESNVGCSHGPLVARCVSCVEELAYRP